MENEKSKNNGLILLVIVLFVLVLGLGGYIVYDKALSNNNNQTNTTDNNTNNNSEIDSAVLNNLYDVLGINWNTKTLAGHEGELYDYGNCLNYLLSNNNYKDASTTYGSNAKRIFAIYASHINANTSVSRRNSSKCGDECQRQLSCADCGSILKTNADKIIRQYNLNDYKLTELAGFDTDYTYLSSGTQYNGSCHYDVKHDLNSKYVDNNTIEITDKQVATDYDALDSSKITSTKNQEVTYTFKKDSDGNYYLSQVSVK